MSIKSKALRAINRPLGRLGFSLSRRQPAPQTDGDRLNLLLKSLGITLVLDIGANEGQSSKHLREAGYRGRIISFEPVPSAAARLRETARGDALWEVLELAVGEAEGDVEINASEVDDTSSILSATPLTGQIAPGSMRVQRIRVPMTCVDRILASVTPDERIFLKSDTQGYDVHVLRGAGAALPRISLIRAEVIAIPLYEGQPALHDIAAITFAAGFNFCGLIDCEFDARSGRLLWGDALFINRTMAPDVSWK
jgi:FkbM family methyltransferase